MFDYLIETHRRLKYQPADWHLLQCGTLRSNSPAVRRQPADLPDLPVRQRRRITGGWSADQTLRSAPLFFRKQWDLVPTRRRSTWTVDELQWHPVSFGDFGDEGGDDDESGWFFLRILPTFTHALLLLPLLLLRLRMSLKRNSMPTEDKIPVSNIHRE